jgi:hypothetical protein
MLTLTLNPSPKLGYGVYTSLKIYQRKENSPSWSQEATKIEADILSL